MFSISDFEISLLSGSIAETKDPSGKSRLVSLFDGNIGLLYEICPCKGSKYRWYGSPADKTLLTEGASLYKVLLKKVPNFTKYMVRMYMGMDGKLILMVVGLEWGVIPVIIAEYPYGKDAKIDTILSAIINRLDGFKEPIKELIYLFDDVDCDGLGEKRHCLRMHSDGEFTVVVY